MQRRSEEKYNSESLLSSVKRGGGSVMIWACISVSSVGLLVETDGIMIAERFSEM